jgi:hypothetical protein
MDIPTGWKKGQRIEISRNGDWVIVEPSFSYTIDGDFDPDTVLMTFHKSDYGKFRDWLKEWLEL